MVDSDISNDLILKYGGKPNEIDAKTLLGSLGSITTLIETVNSEVSGGKKLNIRVKAPERGSFLLHIGLIPEQVADLVQHVDLESVGIVVSTLLNILLLRKALNGEKPQKVEEVDGNVNITTKTGSELTVDKQSYNLSNCNVTINNSLNENFEALKSDSSIDSFEIKSPNGKVLFSVPREDFETMSIKSIEEQDNENQRVIEELTKLNIIKVVFKKGRKWDFLYKGMKISATIKDEGFLKRVAEGESFMNGDCLEADIEIVQVFDDVANAYRHQSYNVLKVHKHIKRAKQEGLNL